jgi:hypothetical protein
MRLLYVPCSDREHRLMPGSRSWMSEVFVCLVIDDRSAVTGNLAAGAVLVHRMFFLATAAKSAAIRVRSWYENPNPERREKRPHSRMGDRPGSIVTRNFFRSQEVRGRTIYKQQTRRSTRRGYPNLTAIQPADMVDVSTTRPTEHTTKRRERRQSRWILNARSRSSAGHRSGTTN